MPDALPLGDLYGGECAAARGALIPLDTIRGCCNHGYARARCARAAEIRADADRFLIRSHAGGTVEILWSQEADHHPVAVGTLLVSEDRAAVEQPIERQARAYVTAYLRRTGRTGRTGQN